MKPSYDFHNIVLGGALAGAPFLPLAGGYPTSLPVPFFIAFSFHWLVGAVFLFLLPVAFWAWSHQLRAGDDTIPRRSLILFLVLVVISLAWTISGYSYARDWQGVGYARLVIAINVSGPLILAAILWRNRVRQRRPLAFAFHWLLFAWFGSYAFAYMGELP